MKQEEISEGNKLIAEFWKDCRYVKREGKTYLKCEGERWKFPQTLEINKLYNYYPIADDALRGLIDPDFSKLKFHTSWDWLMPVLQKIRSNELVTNVNYNIEGDFIIEGLTEKELINIIVEREKFDSDILMIWYGVIEWIKWYNTQEK